LSTNITLKDKFYGCIVGDYIGSAMGAPVENWSYKKIEKEYNTLDKLLSYEHYNNGWKREAGTTEDGVERQKLMVSAIIDKEDRVNCEDVASKWVSDIKEGAAGGISEPFEGTLLKIAKSGLPAKDIGKYCDYSGLVVPARSSQPIGLINAGDIEGAIRDINDVGQLYQVSNTSAIKWSEIVVISIASATKPGATFESVLEDVYRYGDKNMVAELDRGLKHTAECRNLSELRESLDELYCGVGNPYLSSYANEIITKAFCINKLEKADLKKSLIAAVNMGRDTDCTAAVTGCIAGAISGAGSIPDEWIKQADYATKVNKLTNSKRTLMEESEGLYNAYKARLNAMKIYLAEMSVGIGEV
jgi:ADP-ribosylglycohydrolase